MSRKAECKEQITRFDFEVRTEDDDKWVIWITKPNFNKAAKKFVSELPDMDDALCECTDLGAYLRELNHELTEYLKCLHRKAKGKLKVSVLLDEPDDGGPRIFIDAVEEYATIWPPETSEGTYLTITESSDYFFDYAELAEFVQEEYGIGEPELRALVVRMGCVENSQSTR